MIGIYDSGIGGLSIYREIRKKLPKENIIYIADKKYFPYGNRSEEDVKERGDKIISWLKKNKAKIVIIACNTSTVVSLEYLRKKHPNIPIIGTVPVIKTAAEITKTNNIGVMCTPKTAESEYQKKLIEEYADDKNVHIKACPQLVEAIEDGLDFTKYIALILNPINSLKEKNIDTLVLGCTHFPLVANFIKNNSGDKISVLDSGPAIARQTKKILSLNKSLASNNIDGKSEFFTTKNKKEFDVMLRKYVDINTWSGLIEI